MSAFKVGLKVGSKAPAFKLSSDEGEVSLRDFIGKHVVLYFYPKDDTPGCTQEACDFKEAHSKFKKNKAVVFGISKDSVEKHIKFRKKFALPFALLSDEDGKVLEKYGVWKEKSMYGRKYMGIERTTVVIDPQGKIIKIFEKVKVKGHAAEVLALLGNS